MVLNMTTLMILRRPASKSAAQNQQEELGCVLLLGYKYFYNLFGNVGNKS